MEQYKIAEILLDLEQKNQINTKKYNYYLSLWNDLQEQKEHKTWVNNQPI